MRKLSLLAAFSGVLLPGAVAFAAPPVTPTAASPDLMAQTKKAQAALDAGDATDAVKFASQLLRDNTDKTSWNYGNVVYDGNQIIGLAALKLGDIKAAKQALLAAGNTPGSPQLNSFGPQMPLAQALYEKGEHAVVVQFLDEIAKFWATVPAKLKGNEQFEEMDMQHAAIIEAWKKQIAAGKTPYLNPAIEDPNAPPPLPLIAVGTTVPDFTVMDKTGKPIHLSDYRGKTVVLDFWATWCGPCQMSLPHTNTVAAQFADKNVVVLAVNVWDTQKAFDAWIPLHSVYSALTFAIDPAKEQGKDIATTLFHVSGIPTQFVIDGQGRISKSFVGYDGATDALANAITAAK